MHVRAQDRVIGMQEGRGRDDSGQDQHSAAEWLGFSSQIAGGGQSSECGGRVAGGTRKETSVQGRWIDPAEKWEEQGGDQTREGVVDPPKNLGFSWREEEARESLA